MWAEIGSIMVMGGNRAFFLIYHMIKGQMFHVIYKYFLFLKKNKKMSTQEDTRTEIGKTTPVTIMKPSQEPLESLYESKKSLVEAAKRFKADIIIDEEEGEIIITPEDQGPKVTYVSKLVYNRVVPNTNASVEQRIARLEYQNQVLHEQVSLLERKESWRLKTEKLCREMINHLEKSE
jgi:NhaP-type Na+/H+ and K+/H+ antiporter